jgi:UDP-N-acetylglucosamine 2-epimerase (non-hydrolysing)
MDNPVIDMIAGAQPNSMKVAPIIRELRRRTVDAGVPGYRLVHTAQHYDVRMSGDFFEQLGIPAPDVNLEVGSGTQAEQTAGIMTRYERILPERRNDLRLVVGDAISAIACAIAAQKLCVKVAHVEAGIRSGDWSMPEEIDRLVNDAITNYFFTTSEVASAHLRRAGVPERVIYFVGNMMIDTLKAHWNDLRPPAFWDELGLQSGRYFVVTLHRPANVDDAAGFARLIEAIAADTRSEPVMFPVHPRTAKTLRKVGALPDNLKLVEPQPYLQFNHLFRHTRAVITDSGGVTEETTVMEVLCMILRTTTERLETVTMGMNEPLGVDPSALGPALERLFEGQWKHGEVPPLWDGKAAERFVTHLQLLLRN